MYSKVIVPLDGSGLAEQALTYAQLIAGSMSIPIELIEAFDILPPAVRDKYTPYIVRMMLDDAQERSESYLAPIRGRLDAAGYTVSTSTLRGMPADAIVALAGADSEALVVMSTHGRGGISRWVLGSVADKVLHSISNPVLVVRATQGSVTSGEISLKTVLVPLDGSKRAEMSLPHAVGIASALEARISLLRVTPPADYYHQDLASVEPRLIASGESGWMSADDLIAADAGEVGTYLSDLKGRLSGDFGAEVTAEHQQRRNAAQVIIDTATAQSSLVVMTTHGRSGLGRMVLGSVTDRVVRHSNSPVLVIR